MQTKLPGWVQRTRPFEHEDVAACCGLEVLVGGDLVDGADTYFRQEVSDICLARLTLVVMPLGVGVARDAEVIVTGATTAAVVVAGFGTFPGACGAGFEVRTVLIASAYGIPSTGMSWERLTSHSEMPPNRLECVGR